MQSGIVFDIMHFSTRDGPGIRTTVFLKGCPLHCAWCHNPESQSPQPQMMPRPNLCIGCLACLDACPHSAIAQVDGRLTYIPERCELCGRCLDACMAGARELVGRRMTTADVLAEIEKDRVFFDESGGGVTFSGGEALLQYDFLVELLAAARAAGIHTVLDTSGYCAPDRFEALLPLVDLVLYDIKSMDDDLHREFTGVSNQVILANLRRLSVSGVSFQIRYPFIPGVNDSAAQMQALGRLASDLPGLLGIEILPFHQIGLEKYRRLQMPYRLPDLLPPAQDVLQASADVLRCYNVEVSIGG
jgi:pyruvate formate lyase activating enzyme